MAVTTTDIVQTAIGAKIIAIGGFTADQVLYQMDPVDSPYPDDMVYVNESNIEKKKLLKDLYYNTGISAIVCWVNQSTNPAVNLRTDLNTLIDRVAGALANDPTYGGIVKMSETTSIITDGGAYAVAGKAVAKIFLKLEYLSVS
jgi:hypothetical protein